MAFDPQDKNALVTFHRQALADGLTEIRGSDGQVWGEANEYVQAFIAGHGELEVRPYVAPEPVAPPKLVMSKLKLIRALRAVNLETALDAYLASYSQAAKDWNAATEISEDDPIVTVAIPAMCAATGITADQARALMESARKD